MKTRKTSSAPAFELTDPGLVSEKVVALAYDEASKRAESSNELISRIQDKCLVLLGWLIVIETSVFGLFISLVCSDAPSVVALIMAGYGISAVAVLIFMLVKGALYGVSSILPGDDPAHFLGDNVLESLNKVQKGKELQYIKGWFLRTLQYNYDYNSAVALKVVKAYRRTVVMAAVFFVCGLLLCSLVVLLI